MSDPVRTFYNAQSLQRTVEEFERVYRLDSATFLAAYKTGEPPEGVPRFAAFAWANFVEEIERLQPASDEDADPIDRIGHTLVLS